MSKPITRRTFMKRLFGSVLGLFGIGGGTYYYARYVEPSMLTVQEETISSAKIPASFHNKKILQFSDTHIGFHYDLGQFQQLIESIQSHEPDLLLFTGDLIDAPDKETTLTFEKVAAILSKLEAPMGKYWIYGNHDHGGYGTEVIANTMKEAGFTLLQNNQALIDNSGEQILLAGLDDVMLGKPNIEKALGGNNDELFTILLCHEPDYAESVKHYKVDVQLSGHSHGGQVQIPFLGHLVTPPLAERYVEGWYSIGAFPLSLYVSRGIGTTREPYRFLCRPEYTIHTLKQT
ncbi:MULTISPECIES: metallophosphoesterase [Pontibacillus]|uniref:Metallophosphoesterase n=1 Tax=Pontibacillus chungwhensis TaxID=265426 RepID=A0ABY8V4K2_9BACI|nr:MULTISPECIES: metallophosphoesterase [Pontibacillus]MCD5322494.1 metallophosphoesterase [Pontibacillus sp. HN14]WIF99779.1 metallophosphoesterase [Pontibacillus chungwhensis]